MFSRLNKSYLYLLGACLIGYVWLTYHFLVVHNNFNHKGVCFFKNVTNIPCPSCGATRSVLKIIQGDFYQASLINPLGILIALLLIIIPIWVTIDLITKRLSMLNFWYYIEKKLKNPLMVTLVIVMVGINWIWNIYKNL
jgi:hypothetical protein